MIQIALVDDDISHLELMKSYLKRYSKEEQLEYRVREFQNGLNFAEDCDGRTDIAFLDIEMPHMNGLEAAKIIRDRSPALGIIFITNMAQYAIQGYEVNAIDFIVKPIGYYVFAYKFKKALRFVERNAQKEMVIDAEDAVVRLKISRISYIEKDKNYLLYHVDKDIYRVRGTMAAAEDALQTEAFSKCISGCLVNLRYVTRIAKDTINLEAVSLPLSRQRKREFKQDFMK